MSKETDAWRAAIAQARAEGVAEGRRLERAEVLALIERQERVNEQEMEQLWADGELSQWAHLLGWQQGITALRDQLRALADAPPVRLEAPTSAPVTPDVASVVEGTALAQGERGGHSDG